MKAAFATALLAGLAAAAPSTQVQARDDKAIEKRLGPFGLAVAGGVVSGIVGALAKQFLSNNSKRGIQTFQEFQSGFALNVANGISAAAHDDEASLCVKTGNYTLDDDVKVRGLATVELTSSDNDVSDFDCFFVSGNGTLTLNVADLAENFAVKAGPCTFEDLVLTCSS